VYGPRDEQLSAHSFGTLHVCAYRGQENLVLISVNHIQSVVSMQPFPFKESEPHYADLWFVVEKLGLDDVDIGGAAEELN